MIGVNKYKLAEEDAIDILDVDAREALAERRALGEASARAETRRDSVVAVLLAGCSAETPQAAPLLDGQGQRVPGTEWERLSLASKLMGAFRQTNTATPVVLMGYANPIEAMGQALFAERARNAGVDGVLVVDYPPEEAGEFAQLLEGRQIAPIFLLAPTTPEARIIAIGPMATTRSGRSKGIAGG